MKNYSLVRKLGSFVGSATLTSGLLFSIGSQSVAAAGSFLESKFFKIVYKLISDDDLKVFNADTFWEQQTTKKGVNVNSLKKRSLIFLIKLKKFCDIMSRNKDIQNNKLKKEKIDALKYDIETVLAGDISEKIDKFFKSDFFERNVDYFNIFIIRKISGSEIIEEKDPVARAIIFSILNLKDEDLLSQFKQLYQNYNRYLVLFCYDHFEGLATTFYNRINMLLYLGKISDFGSGVLKAGEEYLEGDSEKSVLARLNRIKAYSEDLIKSGILTEEQLYEVLHTCYQFLTIIDMKYQDEVNKLVSCKEEGSFRKYISELAQASSIYKTRVVWMSDPRFKKILAADKKLQASLKKTGLDLISQENCFFDTEYGSFYRDGKRVYEDFLKSDLFLVLCATVTEEDIKGYDVNDFWLEQEKFASNNEKELPKKRIWTLVKLWKFADRNTDENIQKDKSRRKLALKFKEDVEKVLKGKTEDFKDISDATADVLKANKYEDLFFNKENEFVKGKFFKYSPVVKEIYNGYFKKFLGGKKAQQIEEMFRFVNSCELVKDVLKDGTCIKRLGKNDLYKACINISCFSKDLVSSCFCSPENLIKVFSTFSEALPGFQPLKTSINRMKDYLAKGEFSEFIKAYQEGARFAYEAEGKETTKKEDKKTTADILNEVFKDQLSELNSSISTNASLQDVLDLQYGNIFSNVNIVSSNAEGGFFTANIGK